MSESTNIRAAQHEPSALSPVPSFFLCEDFVDGFCRRGERCSKSHDICVIEATTRQAPPIKTAANILSLNPRRTPHTSNPFEHDGPGHLSRSGPRHDNDQISIKDIKILPTTDEILCQRGPYMPSNHTYAHHRLPCGQDRLLDVQFRLLRYESTENIIDACYHASQQLSSLLHEAPIIDYDDRFVTPRGFRYSLFRDATFEDVSFSDQKGVCFRMSFACPRALRGRRMTSSGHLEEGMLVALIGLDRDSALSVTFMEIYQRQTTDAMKHRTGNDLRASVIISLADTTDTDAVRHLLYRKTGLQRASFILVDIPKALYAGFSWTLKQLQTQYGSEEEIAFLSCIAPSTPGISPTVSPPQYTNNDGFSFQVDTLRKRDPVSEGDSLDLKPEDLLGDVGIQNRYIDTLCKQTTLDRGQATAMCENLCRGLAFTQGPPGTGKTFLGVSLTKVLLSSRGHVKRKPILVVCMTNHALDSFLDDLRKAGITKLARMGSNSKENWTKEIQLSALQRRLKRTTYEVTSSRSAHHQVEGLTTEGISWCESLNTQSLSWPAVRDHLRANYPNVLNSFAGLERVDESTLSDIRLARKAGGFAFEYWCAGGDIKDINRLLEHFSTMLGDDRFSGDFEIHDGNSLTRVWTALELNAATYADASNKDDVWKLSLNERGLLLQKWKEEIDPRTIIDRTAEIHRRHQAAVSRKRQARSDVDMRCLGEQDVIGMTTTACAMHWSTLKRLCLQVVICEEAGEVMEAQSLCTLFPSVEHAISIGDPLQLRPQVNQQVLSLETDIGASYRLDESLMERMMLPSTPGVNPIPISQLNTQRRMHPEIANIMRATLYPYLEDHESTQHRAPVAGIADRVWWFDHQMPEDQPDPRSVQAKSFSNTFEVEMVAGLVEYLVNTNEYDFKDITIITPYNGQLAALTQRLSSTCSLWLSEEDREKLLEEGLIEAEDIQAGAKIEIGLGNMLKLATIDSFQGEESKIVIFTTVRSNLEGRVGFLRTPNRINVGCSRAKDGFYIVGNSSLMRSVEMWRQIADELTVREKIGPYFRACCPRHTGEVYGVQTPEQWFEIPECKVACGMELVCGHICKLTCHASSLHTRIACLEPCQKQHDICGHQCTKICGVPCGECAITLSSIEMPCGHEAQLTCGQDQDFERVKCDFLIESAQLPCGHWQDRHCSTKDEPLQCKENCKQFLTCGHQCGGSCSSCTSSKGHGTCITACSKQLVCGHRCSSPCHKGVCPPCRSPCQRTCQHGKCKQECNKICDPCVRACGRGCPHVSPCKTMCCLPCDILPCNEPCAELLRCGHLCPSLCDEKCPDYCPQCTTGIMPSKTMMFLRCGHQFDLKVLDDHVGLSAIYQMNCDGRIEKIDLEPRNPSLRVRPSCPLCGKDLGKIRRYLHLDQLSKLEGNIDRLAAKFSRVMYLLLNQMYDVKSNLDQTYEPFKKALRAGPLSGKTNEDLLRYRGNSLAGVTHQIQSFRNDVIRPFEHDIARLEILLGVEASSSEIVMNSPWYLRFDALYSRSRLIVLEEALRMIIALKAMRNPSDHTLIMIGAIEDMTVTEAKEHVAALKNFISDCEEKNLKRLEAEFRLIQACYHFVLSELGTPPDYDVDASLSKTEALCKSFPDTAGLLMSTHIAIKTVVAGGQRPTNLFKARDIWWTWPRHRVGYLKHCVFGHPYSSETWSGCPECGREAQRTEPADPQKFLKENDFVAAMGKQTFDSNRWRT